jgi:long-chain acyl-CoA synthetase
MNIAKISEERVRQQGEQVTLIFEGREITNLEMLRTGKRIGSALRSLGVNRGDRVILQMPNCPEVLQSFYAVWKIGAVVVPINHLTGDEETAYICGDSGAKAAISSQAFLPKIKVGQARAPGLKNLIFIDKDVDEGNLSYRQLAEGSSEDLEPVETADDELAALIYTAGTTGRPKGVMHSHSSLYMNAKMQYETVPLPDGLTSITVLPLCHSFGIASMNNGLFRRGKTVLLNSFSVETIFGAIEKYRAHIMAGVPTMYVFMVLYPEPKKFDLSSMKYWISGAAPLALETWKKFRDAFGYEIIEGWGLTEAGANNSVNPFAGVKKVGSIGQPMKGTEMRIVDEEGTTLPPMEEGEIVLRGPMLMKGYWNKPEETSEVIRDGWLHTGDIGYMDKDRYFWITDRKKDLVIKGGENISPRVIEEVLFRHAKVSEAAVIGMKDDVYGEDIKAFVVLNPGQTASAEEMIDYCQRKLTSFLVPRQVAFLKALPKNLVGKVLKRELRNL